MHQVRLRRVLFGFAASVFLLAGCATPPSDPLAREAYVEANDPLEPVNRRILDANLLLDRYAVRPSAAAYRAYTPAPLRQGIRNFLRNLRSPMILANNLLQGDLEGAGNTAGRFFVNTIAGLGFFDPAARIGGMPFRDEDFGQTLAVWGVPEGPYVMLPVAGPSTLRDSFGILVELVADPLVLVASESGSEWMLGVRSAATVVDERESMLELLDDVYHSSLDVYATLRSLYRQSRAQEIGIETELPSFDDF